MSLIYLCLVFIGWASFLVSAQPLSAFTNYTFDYVSINNGNYSNLNQSQQNSSQAFIQYRSQPLFLTNISPRPLLYIEIALGRTVILAQIIIINQVSGPSIRLDPYNVTAARGTPFGTFNTNTLRNTTRADLGAATPACVSKVARLAKAVYTENKPDCKFSIGGNFTSIGLTYTCQTIGILVQPSFPELYNSQPYLLTRISGSRYSTLGFPDNYPALC